MLSTEEVFADAMASVVLAATEPLMRRIAELEQRMTTVRDGKDGQPGRDGRDGVNGRDGSDGLAGKDGAVGLTGKDGADGLDGKDGAVGLNGKDGAAGLTGKDGADGLDGRDGAQGLQGKDGAAGIDGQSGISGKDGSAGRDGKDGRDGLNGKDGTNGINGKDGLDGLGFDDVEFISRGARGMTLKFTRGDRVKSFDWDAPIPIYRGIFEVGKSYESGDMVTRQGSVWFCHTPTSEIPGDGTKSWQLCVKRGGPGPKGDPGVTGATGKAGVDLTQMDPNTGLKW